MKLTSQQEMFAQLVANGKNQSDAYREAYPKADGWKKVTVWSAASRMARKVDARIKEIQDEMLAMGIWMREQSVRSLISVVQEPDKKSDVVAAVKELNQMHGYNEPTKIDVSGRVGVIIRRFI